jgi:hypothetical protein
MRPVAGYSSCNTTLSRKSRTGVNSSAIEIDEWIAGWSKVRENIASAPGGHYGHYDNAAVIAKLPKARTNSSPDLDETYATMLSLPLEYGCTNAILKILAAQSLKSFGSSCRSKLTSILLRSCSGGGVGPAR